MTTTEPAPSAQPKTLLERLLDDLTRVQGEPLRIDTREVAVRLLALESHVITLVRDMALPPAELHPYADDDEGPCGAEAPITRGPCIKQAGHAGDHRRGPVRGAPGEGSSWPRDDEPLPELPPTQCPSTFRGLECGERAGHLGAHNGFGTRWADTEEDGPTPSLRPVDGGAHRRRAVLKEQGDDAVPVVLVGTLLGLHLWAGVDDEEQAQQLEAVLAKALGATVRELQVGDRVRISNAATYRYSLGDARVPERVRGLTGTVSREVSDTDPRVGASNVEVTIDGTLERQLVDPKHLELLSVAR